MTLSCSVCKRFVATNSALHCERIPRHVLHEDCGLADAGEFWCPICRTAKLVRRVPRGSAGPAGGEALAPSASTNDTDALQGLLATLLEKVTNIETKLESLSAVNVKLEQRVCQLASSLIDLTTKTEALSLKTDTIATSLRLNEERQARLSERVSALESRPSTKSGRDPSVAVLETRMEALERDRLSTELILFGVKEPTPEDPRTTAASIATALDITVSPGDIVSCHRIPARGDRPRPLIVKLLSNEARCRWIAGKRARGVLEGSSVSSSFAGSRIEINERLPASTRRTLDEARRAARDGRLHRAWVRNGIVLVKSHPNTSPIRLRHIEHLQELTAGASRPSTVAGGSLLPGPSNILSAGVPGCAPDGSALPSSVPSTAPVSYAATLGAERGQGRGAIPKRPPQRKQ